MTLSTLESLALNGSTWTAKSLHLELAKFSRSPSLRTVQRNLLDTMGDSIVSSAGSVTNASGNRLNPLIVPALTSWLAAKKRPLEILQIVTVLGATVVVMVNSKGRMIWRAVNDSDIRVAISEIVLAHGTPMAVLPHGAIRQELAQVSLPNSVTDLSSLLPPDSFVPRHRPSATSPKSSNYLDDLEQESINIIREAVAVASKPGMLFSMGKDSMVNLTLARKAFAPHPIPFPLLLIDTQWMFQDMYRFLEGLETDNDISVISYVNPEAIERNINPFDFGSAIHTDITLTQAVRKALSNEKFDFIFGGARRDEEKSRAKERIFSVRNSNHGWDPKQQRPELWNLYNTTLVGGQTMRVFPLSNWTEIDIWRYLERENVDLIPLYYSALRPYVRRNEALIMVDDERFPLEEDEEVLFDYIRFRTLGCYPLTGAVVSHASSISEIISELEGSKISERSSRVIDFDQGASMEQKKKDGYF